MGEDEHFRKFILGFLSKNIMVLKREIDANSSEPNSASGNRLYKMFLHQKSTRASRT